MIYDTDTIEHYTIATDKYGAETKSTAVEYDCVVDDVLSKQIKFTTNGQESMANYMILIDDTFPGQVGDRIKLKEIFFSTNVDTKEYQIKAVHNVGGFGQSHKEVYL